MDEMEQWEATLVEQLQREAELAIWAAERSTLLNEPGKSTSTTTPPKRESSPPAVREPSGRLAMSELPQPKKLMMAGDWHGNLPWAFKAINYAKANGADAILHVGDFGWWAPGASTLRYLSEINKELDALGITLFWVDGNHEFHEFLDDYQKPGNWAWCSDKWPRIFHLPRGFRWDWWGDTWMALGGAYSVDRTFGVEGQTWWAGETLTDAQVDYACRPGNVDIIVAHDAPTNVAVPGIVPGKPVYLPINGLKRRVPEVELMRANAHRDLIQQVCDVVKPVEFYHGHYHRAYSALARVEGGGYMNVRGLDKDETTVQKNTHFITEGTKDDDDDDGDDIAW